MKRKTSVLFYTGLTGLAVFEILNVYFIMPFPGSQEINSLNTAYFLYSYRWFFRVLFILLVLAGSAGAFTPKRWWIPAAALAVTAGVTGLFNLQMTADHMFRQPVELDFAGAGEPGISDSMLVIAVGWNGEVKAYPIRYLSYHHQVQDTVGNKRIMVTYCNVCRTGRVYEPLVKGKYERFRLVGMDHYNAMFEDETTKSWWRQANGVAVTGPLAGDTLPEMHSMQLSVKELFRRYPLARVMLADAASKASYDSLGYFEQGKTTSRLTGTDTASWQPKSWVVGVETEGMSKAYDWKMLIQKRLIEDQIGTIPVIIVLFPDDQGFAAFERPTRASDFSVRGDTLFHGNEAYNLEGHPFSPSYHPLKRLKARQEFWHSWITFHPQTEVYRY
jgi:hypothetical protein